MYKPALDTPQAFDCRATAALLRSLAPLTWASHAAAILAALLAPRHAWPALLLWGAVLYFSVRVHLDAALFELLAQDPAAAPARLDHWLHRSGLRRPRGSRSLDDRCRGARRLALFLLCAFLAQLLALAFVWLRRTA